jgi:hypothetical protein
MLRSPTRRRLVGKCFVSRKAPVYAGAEFVAEFVLVAWTQVLRVVERRASEKLTPGWRCPFPAWGSACAAENGPRVLLRGPSFRARMRGPMCPLVAPTRSLTGFSSDRCPQRVRLGHGGMSALSPFYPQLRTLVGDAGTAASCQEATYAPQQAAIIRSPHQRSRAATVVTVGPSILAVSRLITSSSFVARSTGSQSEPPKAYYKSKLSHKRKRRTTQHVGRLPTRTRRKLKTCRREKNHPKTEKEHHDACQRPS